MQFLWFPVWFHCVPGLCGKFLLQSLLPDGSSQCGIQRQLWLRFPVRLRLLQYDRFRL